MKKKYKFYALTLTFSISATTLFIFMLIYKDKSNWDTKKNQSNAIFSQKEFIHALEVTQTEDPSLLLLRWYNLSNNIPTKLFSIENYISSFYKELGEVEVRQYDINRMQTKLIFKTTTKDQITNFISNKHNFIKNYMNSVKQVLSPLATLETIEKFEIPNYAYKNIENFHLYLNFDKTEVSFRIKRYINLLSEIYLHLKNNDYKIRNQLREQIFVYLKLLDNYSELLLPLKDLPDNTILESPDKIISKLSKDTYKIQVSKDTKEKTIVAPDAKINTFFELFGAQKYIVIKDIPFIFFSMLLFFSIFCYHLIFFKKVD